MLIGYLSALLFASTGLFQNHMTYDPVGLINTSIAAVIATATALVLWAVVAPQTPAAARRRFVRAMRHTLARIAAPRSRIGLLRAPVNGFVTNLTLEVGQYTAVGTEIMALIDSNSYRGTGYFEETKIPTLRLGQEAKMYLLNGSPALRGHVESIARAIIDADNTAGPELLVNPNPTFEWVRLAQRIPVRIHIDDVPKGVLISSGMTCTVVLEAPPRQSAVLAALREWRAAARGEHDPAA